MKRENDTPQKITGRTGNWKIWKLFFYLKSVTTMNYNITKHTAPAMPTLGKGTECIIILLSQASKDMQKAVVPMFFPVLGAHLSGAEFQYPDLTWRPNGSFIPAERPSQPAK